MAGRREHEGLGELTGVTLGSEYHPGVSYRLERLIGEGGMGVAFFALRTAPDGFSPVVLKVVRPSVVAQTGPTASMIVQKESVALGRLNERVPPTPFVVRFIDTGSMQHGRGQLPWLAVEYVHGGVEGTTLEQRTRHSCRSTGYAFDAVRAARAIRCMASGLAAIHEVGVIHRDLSPGNVLCCGFGEAEIFKISDFGLARPSGFRDTFGDVFLGTPGFGAPEQCFPGEKEVGTYSDVFSLACVAFFILTGERYFEVDTPPQAIIAMRESKRRKLIDTSYLSPELRDRPESCDAIDALLAKATASDVSQRPARAQELSASIVPWLGDSIGAASSRRRRVESLIKIRSPFSVSGWSWTVRRPPGDERVVRSVAWDVDGHCLAATTTGLAFWNGTEWVDAPTERLPTPGGIRFARRLDAGEWLVGGEHGAIAIYSNQDVREITRSPDPSVSFDVASGQLDDLLIALDQRPGQTPTLHAMAARRWMKPLPLPDVIAVTGVARLDDSRWLLCGRNQRAGGFAAIYSPMQWEVTDLSIPQTRAMLACQSQPERGFAIAAGSAGLTVRVEGSEAISSVVGGQPDLSAAAADVLDREWVACAGRLFVKEPTGTDWQCVWEDPAWTVPFVSLMADVGLVVAMTVDGAVLEGRGAWQPPARSSSSRMSPVPG